jgi:hypothetical protein
MAAIEVSWADHAMLISSSSFTSLYFYNGAMEIVDYPFSRD